MAIPAKHSDAALWQISPSLVHKRNPENVWVRQPRPPKERELQLEFSSPAHLSDARLADLIEVQRQAGIYFAHSHLGAPHGHVFILSSVSIERSSWSLDRHVDVRSGGGAVVVRECADGHPETRSGFTKLHFQLSAGTGTATGTATVRILSPRAYKRVRRMSVPPLPPQTVGGSWRSFGTIIADADDPLLSDHVSDHVPAMAVIMSIEQGVLAAGALRIDALSADFRAYVEEDEEAIYRFSFGEDGAFFGVVEQAATVCAKFIGRGAINLGRATS